MENAKKQTTSNGWQNIGIFYLIGEEAGLNNRDLRVFMYIVRKSVGYGDPYTFAKPMIWFHKDCGIGRKQWLEATKHLEEIGLIIRKGHYGNLKGGGSTPFKYGPVFPDSIDIWLKEKYKEKKELEPIDETKEEEAKRKYIEGWSLVPT